MKLLMGIILAIVAFVFVPGLFWIFAAGAVAYGLIVAVVGAIGLLVMIAFVMWPSISGWISKLRTEARIEQANRAFREKERLRIEALKASESWEDDSREATDARKSCSKCQMEMALFLKRCPSCGHQIKQPEP